MLAHVYNVCYRSGKDFIDVGKAVKVTYSSGEWSGKLVRDKVGFAEFSMEMSHFSLITSSTDFFIEGAEWVGILGMAYQSLAKVYTVTLQTNCKISLRVCKKSKLHLRVTA